MARRFRIRDLLKEKKEEPACINCADYHMCYDAQPGMVCNLWRPRV